MCLLSTIDNSLILCFYVNIKNIIWVRYKEVDNNRDNERDIFEFVLAPPGIACGEDARD